MPKRDWNSRFDMRKSFMLAWGLLGLALTIVGGKIIESILLESIGGVVVFFIMFAGVVYAGWLLSLFWKFYNE